MIEIEQELFELSAHGFDDVVINAFQLAGSFAAGFSVVLFTVWGVFHVVRFLRQIIKTGH